MLGDDPAAPPPGQRRLALPAPVELARWRARRTTDTAALEAALLQLAAQVAGDTPPPCSPRVQRAVERARELLASDLARPLTLAETAAAVHCSPHHLARQFQRVNGVGPHGYRTRLRMLAALERLREGEDDLSALAQDLGFASHSHFSARFRAHWGLTPQQMRKDLTAATRHCSQTRRLRAAARASSMWDSNKAIGMAMGLAAAVVGGGWQVATRGATTGSLPPADLVILRYGVPALLLLPVWRRIGAWPAALTPLQRRRLPLLVLCAGLPFGAVAMWGSSLAPSAHMGVWMAGASPIVTALLAWALWRERPDGKRLAGLALMLLGLGLLAMQSLQPGGVGTWRGDLLFLLAATLWSGYTLAFRGSGLTPWQGAALVNLWSFFGVGLWLLWRGGSTLHLAPLPDIAWQALWQGLFGGVLGLWTFSVAIQRLGAAPAAAFAALAPMVSSVGGWWFLGDPLGPVEIAAVAAAVAGVLVVNGAGPRRLRT